MLKKLTAAIIASAAFIGALETPAHSATFKPIAQGKSLVMTGDVVPGDADRLRAAYWESYQKNGYAPERVFLNSNGGDVLAGIHVTDVIEDFGLHTVVGRTDTCLSICVTIFASGTHRVVFPSSTLGVHSVGMAETNQNGEIGPIEDNPEARSLTVSLARLMGAYGAPASLIAKMVTTPPDQMSELYWEDVAGWVELLD